MTSEKASKRPGGPAKTQAPKAQSGSSQTAKPRRAEAGAEPAAAKREFRVAKVAAPLRQIVTENLRTAIGVGRFKPGDRLPEREICELLGVSRTLVREALRQLESEGLIRVEDHRGPIVSNLTRKEIEQVYQVREELESLASRLFAERAGEQQFEALREAFEGVRAGYGAADPVVRLQAKNRFYDRLIEGTGNEALGVVLRMEIARATLMRAAAFSAPGRTEASVAELKDLMDALARRDPDAAAEAGRRHVRRAAAAATGQAAEAEDAAAP